MLKHDAVERLIVCIAAILVHVRALGGTGVEDRTAARDVRVRTSTARGIVNHGRGSEAKRSATTRRWWNSVPPAHAATDRLLPLDRLRRHTRRDIGLRSWRIWNWVRRIGRLRRGRGRDWIGDTHRCPHWRPPFRLSKQLTGVSVASASGPMVRRERRLEAPAVG